MQTMVVILLAVGLASGSGNRKVVVEAIVLPFMVYVGIESVHKVMGYSCMPSHRFADHDAHPFSFSFFGH